MTPNHQGQDTIRVRSTPLLWGVVAVLLLASSPAVRAETTEVDVIAQIDSHWSAARHREHEDQVRAFLVPLGAMKKIRGVWRLKAFEPVNGDIRRITWQVEGYPVTELFDDIAESLTEVAELRWQCVSRSCGNGSEWASRVYGERLLYGRDEFMRYSAFRTPQGQWLMLFSAARTADRQYLHLDVITPETD